MWEVDPVLGYRVLLVGALPPPIGGVTTHIKRFIDYAAAIGVIIPVLDIKKKSLFYGGHVVKGFSMLSMVFRVNTVHIHVSSNAKLLIAISFWLLGKNVIYTHHNSIVKSKLLFRAMLFFCSKVIFVNADCGASFLEKYSSKVVILPAFIPPAKNDLEIPGWLNDEVLKYKFVISSNCYALSYLDGEEVYGFDLIIDAFVKLDATGNICNTLLVLLDPSGTYANKHNYESLIGSENGNRVLYIASENISFSALLRRTSVSIRATRTDGDSLSVRESLHFGVPVIASDVVERPSGVILFKNNSSSDLSLKIAYALKLKHLNDTISFNCAEELFKIYNELGC